MSFEYGKTLRNGLALCVLAGVLNGCANTGDLGNLGNLMGSLNQGAKKYDVSYLKQTIIPGKTTKSQITQMFGAPTNEELNSTSSSNESNWTYEKSDEGLDKYMKLANKYVSTETRMKMADTSAQLSKAQTVANDVSSVTGGKTGQSQTQGSVLTIYFVDDVVKYYRVY
ncbi:MULTISPECIES: hypothetical protein [unclassified Pseudomonas]|uniref:hypothetical protein n=1 Tax=unclassified Pseudomonas TaxID=196821 RepID=UPI000871235D|nr:MULTISPECIES: hypothetical protein [unclassified Pseudomonas]SCW67833.1 hypothetical protein SAMN03159481_01898 [Pseudomonas sp. NFACC56-3]SCX93494.1 hypothetical protein SAMN03159391_00529 [Pseudomonas sp. NFACC37-1]SFK33051.1 hypothetical protein SAMN03159473_01422 [Pseudomonas sp. NFACC52]SFN76575.1 hypothetical protein SAMN03159304_00966 [Pseudomonas sp. NFACC24-1]